MHAERRTVFSLSVFLLSDLIIFLPMSKNIRIPSSTKTKLWTMYQLIVAFNKINGSGPIFVRAVCWRHNWFSVVGNQEDGIMNHLCYYKKYCSSFVQKHQFRFPCLKNFSPSGLRALHGTKCPLLTAFFFLFLLLSALVTFLPERVVLGFWNFAWAPYSQ